MVENRTHWYDGSFYNKFIAPQQDELFDQISNIIVKDSTIIDVGCGTGRFAFTIADKCKSVLGIDLSKRNIEQSQLNLSNCPNKKISFQHKNLNEVLSEGKHFDYALITYVIHEVAEIERIELMKQLSEIADTIIIGDYLVPRPNNFKGFFSRTIEFVAGKDHYRNFRNYVANGGIQFLVDEAGLVIVSEIKNHSSLNHIVQLKKRIKYP